jgi:hypothetical protein
MVLDRRGLEAAATSSSIGLLADDVLLALLRQIGEQSLTERDREVLTHALELLRAFTELRREQVATGHVLRAMAPLTALDESTSALASALSGDMASEIQKYIQTIDTILSGQANDDSVLELQAFFERLAEETLERSRSMFSSPREDISEWIRKASTS